MDVSIIEPAFYERPTLTAARELLGQRLVRQINGQRLSGLIVETEAYISEADSACHCRKGRTARTEVLYGPPGQSYVYLIYGMYHMLNLVTERAGFPAAVLIRAIEPVEGLEAMQTRRSRTTQPVNLTNGPGKLCQALAIDRTLHNWNVTEGRDLWLERGNSLPDSAVATGPRIGIAYAEPEDRAASWRFWVRNNRFVSK